MTDAERDALLIQVKTQMDSLVPAVTKLDSCVGSQNGLFIRIDERTTNIYRLTEQNESHLRQINGTVQGHTLQIDGLLGEVYGRDQKEGLIAGLNKTRSAIQKISLILVALGASGALGVSVWKIIEYLMG